MPVVDRYDKMVLQFRDVLAETERLSPDELEAYQQQLLEPRLLHARQHVPFYAQRLAPAKRKRRPFGPPPFFQSLHC
jgi:phenylacetate-coenzyme A ligase PaaK-like adenylate-forming protein